MAAVEQRIQYQRELHAGDIITIRSAVLEIKDKAVRLLHEMRNDETGEIAARTVIVGVHFDSNARKACSWPDDIRARALMKINGSGGVTRGVHETATQVTAESAPWSEGKTTGDRVLANVRVGSVPGLFEVTNELEIEGTSAR